MPVVTTPDGATVVWESLDILGWLEGDSYEPKADGELVAGFAPSATGAHAARALPRASDAALDACAMLLNCTFEYNQAAGRSGAYGAELAAKLRAVEAAADAVDALLAAGPGPFFGCLLYTSPSPRDRTRSRMPSSA